MGSVTISEYWNGWMQRIVEAGIRKSKAEIVEECLKLRKALLDMEMRDWLAAKKMVHENKDKLTAEIEAEEELGIEEPSS